MRKKGLLIHHWLYTSSRFSTDAKLASISSSKGFTATNRLQWILFGLHQETPPSQPQISIAAIPAKTPGEGSRFDPGNQPVVTRNRSQQIFFSSASMGTNQVSADLLSATWAQ